MYKLLIVDDFFVERENVKDILAESDLPIEVCGECDNGQQALEVIDDLKPDFVLTDVEMPFMNGMELADKLNRSYPDITTVMFSFYDKFEYVKKALESDTYAYILKPIIADEFIDTFIKLIQDKEAADKRVRNEEELKRLVEESKPILSRNFIRELFEGKIKDTGNILDKLSYYDIPYDHNTFNVVVIEIDDYDDSVRQKTYEEAEMLSLRIDQTLDTYNKSNLSLWTRIDYKTWALLTWLGRESVLGIEESVYGLCDHMSETMKAFDISLSFGISDEFVLMTDIGKAVKQGMKALDNKFHFKQGQMIRYEEIQGIETTFELELGRVQKEVAEIVLSGNEGQALKFIRKLFDEMGTGVPKESVRNLCIGIITSIKVTIESQFITLEEILGDEAMVWEKLIRFETIYDIKNWLKNILVFTIRHLNEQKDESSLKISDEVKSYIEGHYGDHITVKEIAEVMHYNPNYLNNVFKEESGITVLEFITSYRVEKAKVLLKSDTSAKVKEISVAVGYNNEAYFRSLFKRHVGLSPKDYRKTARRQREI